MTDLDILRPKVRDAVEYLHDAATLGNGTPIDQSAHVRTIRAELLRLEKIVKDYGFAIDCERRRAEAAEAELAALKARITEAPLEVVESLPGAVGPPWPSDHWIEVRMADPCACVGQGLIGKRVRLVVEE